MQIFNIHSMLRYRYSVNCITNLNFLPAPAIKSRYIPKINLSLFSTHFFTSRIWSKNIFQFFANHGSPRPPCCASWRCLHNQTSRAGPEQSAAIWTATCRYGFNQSESEKCYKCRWWMVMILLEMLLICRTLNRIAVCWKCGCWLWLKVILRWIQGRWWGWLCVG